MLALAASLLQAPAAWGLGEVTGRLQPAKAAALAGYWHSGTTPSVVILGLPDPASQRNLGAWAWHDAGGRWLARDTDAGYIGLDKYSGMQPPVAFVFLSLRAMWLLGGLMFIAAVFSFCLSFRRGYDPAAMPRWWLRVLTAMMFSGGLSVVLGIWVAQVGLQPYIVNRTITQSEVLGAVPASTLWWGLAGYGALYALLLSAFVGMLFHAARYGVVPVRKIGGSP